MSAEIHIGYWVVFDEPDDDGKIPFGFYIDNKRAENWHLELLQWKRNHLVRIFAPIEEIA